MHVWIGCPAGIHLRPIDAENILLLLLLFVAVGSIPDGVA